MNIFEKNPINGGTPAIDNKATVNDLVKNESRFEKLNACIVLYSGKVNWDNESSVSTKLVL